MSHRVKRAKIEGSSGTLEDDLEQFSASFETHNQDDSALMKYGNDLASLQLPGQYTSGGSAEENAEDTIADQNSRFVADSFAAVAQYRYPKKTQTGQPGQPQVKPEVHATANGQDRLLSPAVADVSQVGQVPQVPAVVSVPSVSPVPQVAQVPQVPQVPPVPQMPYDQFQLPTSHGPQNPAQPQTRMSHSAHSSGGQSSYTSAGEGSLTDAAANGCLVTPMMDEQAFENVQQLKDYVKEFGRKHEFGIAIAHSNSKAIYFTCELGGTYREKKRRSQQSSPRNSVGSAGSANKRVGSKKIRCPFAMVANFSKKKHYWSLKITENMHNHPKLNPLVNFPMLRKRSSQVNDTIRELYSGGDKPSVIHEKLKVLYPALIIKREDIYNEVRILKKKGLVPTHTELKKRKLERRSDGESHKMQQLEQLQRQLQQQQLQQQQLRQQQLRQQQQQLQQQQQQQQMQQHHQQQQQHHQHQQQQSHQPQSQPRKRSWSNAFPQKKVVSSHVVPPGPPGTSVPTASSDQNAAAAAVAAVEAFKNDGLQEEELRRQQQHMVSQQQASYQQYQGTPQYQYSYSPDSKEEHFNIDERLMGDS